MTGDDASYDLSLAAATLRSNSGDTNTLLKALCDELSDTLGERLHIQRAGSRFHKSDAISSVQIALDGNQFEANVEGPVLRCSVGRVSGGIRIRNETVEIDQWIVKLLEALKAEATHSESARQALENIVIGGH
ncbi:MAG TPA: hypothetical protein VG246_06630 [Acidimicrobiales bacterium]|jgi:hypothetical protein|nr:hypothetical protein [Acidimicrobiales bacterium]